MIDSHRYSRLLMPGILVACCCLNSPLAQAIEFTMHPLPVANGLVYNIISGPDGDIWFSQGNFVGKIDPVGNVTEFVLDSQPSALATGADGNVWFLQTNAFGKITPAGQITMFTSSEKFGVSIYGFTTGSDGNMYIANQDNNIVALKTQGDLFEHPTPLENGIPAEITRGSDGTLWFAAQYCDSCGANPNTIGTIAPSGEIHQIPIITALPPSEIIGGPDGNIWFVEAGCDSCSPRFPGSLVGKVTPSGVVTEYSPPTYYSVPSSITVGPDGNLWFTESAGRNVAKMTTAGAITEYPIPGASPYFIEPNVIVTGADGNLWFTINNPPQIGEIALNVTSQSDMPSTPALSAWMLWTLGLCTLLVGYWRLVKAKMSAPKSSLEGTVMLICTE